MDFKNCCLLLLSIIYVGCEDVVELELPDSDPRLVIDASFATTFNAGKIQTEGAVILSLSAPFYDTGNPPVNNATVYITNTTTDEVHNFIEVGDSGAYITQYQWNPEFLSQYVLTVISGNETYEGTATLIPTVPLDEVQQGDGTLFSGEETEIVVKFTDNGSRDDHYLFDLDFNLYLTTEDRFYQGEQFVFSYFYEDLDPGQEITVRINGVDRQYHDYMTLLIEQSGQNGSGPFQTLPSTLRGNMVNRTNPDNYAYGYFSLSERNELTLFID
tara:strand:- start:3567 stop:4382 length:816 start_codon:yes stop_codon:yes gene_type:complete